MGKISQMGKKGKKGVAANYLTRNQAVKKLQISLKDFRCALPSPLGIASTDLLQPRIRFSFKLTFHFPWSFTFFVYTADYAF